MAGVIDTNILLYAVNRDAPEHAAARNFLARTVAARPLGWVLTEGIVYEFLRVSTHHRVFGRPLDWREAFDFLRPLMSSGRLTVLSATTRHWDLLEHELPRLPHPTGNRYFDIRTLVLMREHGIHRIYTDDTDFLAFPDIEVINPLRQG